MKKIKLLGLGLLFVFGLIDFSIASFDQYNQGFECSDPDKTSFNGGTTTKTDIGCNDIEGVCYGCFSSACPFVKIYDNDGNLVINGVARNSIFCGTGLKYTNTNSNSPSVRLYTGFYAQISGEECEECQECQSCPTTGDVLSQYCDINYCVSNSLCPVSGSGFEWSALFINNIQFPGHDVINISIPDYIQWDYTSSTGLFDLSVGSGYDQDYIDSVLKINSYRPDSKDFTQIFVSGLTLIFPYIFVALLIMFIWKLLKRIFK